MKERADKLTNDNSFLKEMLTQAIPGITTLCIFIFTLSYIISLFFTKC